MEDTLTVPLGEAVLLDLLSENQLDDMREAHKDNPQVVALIDGRREAKAKVESDAKVLTEFKDLLTLVDLPNPPEGVYNVYNSFALVKRHLTKAEKSELLKTHQKMTGEEADARLVETDEWAWAGWTLNKAMTQGKASISTTATRKLAITLHKRDGNTLTPIGNFPTSKSACVYLNLETGKDSAKRVLEAHHYIVDSYDGTDYIVKPE